MPKVVKTTDVPADPKRLYIYLYCDKLGCYKSTTKKKAAKSWLSLSESKRRRFLKTCRLKKDLNDTQRVLSTEPFLKQLYNSTVEDLSSKNIQDDNHNDSCLDGENEVQIKTCLDSENTVKENEICSPEQQKNETCLPEQQQNEISLDDINIEQNETCLHKQQQNETCLDNVNIEQNETSLHDQQPNKTSLDDVSERQNNTYSENNTEEQNNFVLIESCDNDKDQQRNIERHLNVNSICKEINGSDTESLSNTEEQQNQGTNEVEINNSKTGFINNIKEPIVPTVKNWKELYIFLNKDKNINLQDVSDTVKRTYLVLFKKIRKEYIENYIQYLESLNDKQLYEHYLKES